MLNRNFFTAQQREETNMTKCENLQNKIDLCTKAASRTTGRMRDIWINHADNLKEKLLKMSVKELQEECGRN
jgi:hypothetical protein